MFDLIYRSYVFNLFMSRVISAGLEEVGKFVERKHFLADKFEYPRNGNDPGLVLIFNQENFEYEKDRVGTRRDVNELVECLQRQGFNFGQNNIMHNASADEIKAKLKEGEYSSIKFGT